MKCLCFSDSHGNVHAMCHALNMHRDAEVIFFLGDGLRDFEEFIFDKSRAWLAVQGNCDYSAHFGDTIVKKTDSINILGKRIIFTHGDLYGVKYGLDGVSRLAIENNADIILFGHTHQPLEKYIPTDRGGFYLFNPGSISGLHANYGVINITDSGILLSHGTL